MVLSFYHNNTLLLVAAMKDFVKFVILKKARPLWGRGGGEDQRAKLCNVGLCGRIRKRQVLFGDD